MLRVQQPCLIITFHTTAGAIAAEKLCKGQGIPGRLIPVPRSITSDCGMAWRTGIENRELIEKAAADNDLEISGFHETIY